MSWISDVRADLHQLDASAKALRRFGIVVGGVLLGFALVALISHGSVSMLTSIVGLLGTVLIGLGLLRPARLKVAQLYWMAFAFAMGWAISRIMLMVLFYGVITPIGMFARVTGKKFLDVKFRDGAESYWVQRNNTDSVDYERMF